MSKTFFSFCFVVSLLLFTPLKSWYLEETMVFMWELLKHPRKIGAFAPSSPFLVRALTKDIDNIEYPRNILEIGAGAGHITEAIVKKMSPDDHVDVVEINPHYCQVLQKHFGHHKNVKIFCGSILDWQPNYQYDLIVCTLPFNTFKLDFVDNVIQHVKQLAKPHTPFCYIALLYLKPFKKLLLSQENWQNNQMIAQYMNDFNEHYCYKTEKVLLNIPPAEVYYCILP